jgi:phosphoenolpyruvate synthase/pyruvate phosphate dikinase
MTVLALAAGVVIDNGGETSHGASVSRELGIPCVIGTGKGTATINDNDRIRVDGTRGVVDVLERATAGRRATSS